MTLSLHTRLFLTLFTVCTLVAVGLLLFVRWSFEQGFIEFVAARQEERLTGMVERLAERYRQDGGWQRLRTDKGLWLAVLLDRDDPFRWGREPPGGYPLPRGWLRHALQDDSPNWPPERLPPRMEQEPLPRPLEFRVMLLDAQGAIIYGRQELLADTQRWPIAVDGTPVGYLALLPGPSLADLGDIQFLEHQTSAFLVMALAMVALSAALSFPLAKRLVRPVRAFQDTARALAAGQYTARVTVHSNDELGRLGRDLNALAAALERNEQARRRWVADIAHELRTPLAVLRAELEALQDGIRPLEPAAVDSLHADVQRLGHLVDDLYELSMTDLGALSYHLVETNPVAVLTTDVEAFASSFAEAGLTLSVENRLPTAVTCQADAQRLSQLFRNLLRNSLRYTDPGGGLSIILSREHARLIIDFQDTAPGVPPESLPRLFDRLYRVESSRHRDTGGAGLGLAICRNIAEAHGGTIRAQPSPRGGL
ncbi:MAG TPA: ATP-binding protein [Candidatus Competibacteraceae bacterium]|nr:ATP-binding protein [Candidatus Competibacteraceae bacterium]